MKRFVAAVLAAASVGFTAPAAFAGAPPASVGMAQFNTFSFSAAGPITGTGSGAQQIADLSTTFTFSDFGDVSNLNGDLANLSLSVLFTGPGSPAPNPLSVGFLNLPTPCMLDPGQLVLSCSYQQQITFGPDSGIVPGTTFGATGRIVFQNSFQTIDLATSNTATFVAPAVPEPSVLALLGVGLLALGFSKRKTLVVSPLTHYK